MIVVIDNYDSFAHNLARYFEMEDESVLIVRNDKISIEELSLIDPIAIVISPGPCTPDEAGISLDLIKQLGPDIPILGVCLGHQAIGQVFDGSTERAPTPLHGESSTITHHGSELFADIPESFIVGRYHSLISNINQSSSLRISASLGDIPMAIEHEEYPIYGVQFHPESILTEHGQTIVKNFVEIARRHDKKKGTPPY